MIEMELAIGLPPRHHELHDCFLEYFKREIKDFKFNETLAGIIIRQVRGYFSACVAVVSQAQIINQKT